MNKELRYLIEKRYQLKVDDYSPLKKAWVIFTNKGIFFSKSFVFKDSPRLHFIDGAIRHLVKRNFHHVIPFKKTREGLPCISYKDDVYFLTPFLNTRQCNYDNPQELSKAASLLASLHLSSWGYHPPASSNPQYFWGLWPGRLKEKIQHLYTFRTLLKSKQNWDEFDHLFAKFFHYYFQKANESLEELLLTDYMFLMYNEQLYHTFCHHDYEYHNILITPENDYYIIDFDYLLCDTHLHDLTSLLIRAGRRSKWDGKNRDLVLKSYHKVYPLKKAEIPVIKAMLLFPQDYWQVAFARYFEKQPWPLERFINEITRRTSNENLRLIYINNLTYPG